MSQSELACVYAALILHDDGVEISVFFPSLTPNSVERYSTAINRAQFLSILSTL